MAKREPIYWTDIAELMAREGLSFRESATRLQVPLTSEAASNEFRSKGFQKVLRSARNRFYREIAGDPEWARRTAVGMMLNAAERLMEAGEFDKVLEGLLKIGKMEGWVGADTTVSVIGGLSQADLDQLKAKLLKKQEDDARVN